MSNVYFVQCGATNLIKIGYAKNVDYRIRELQCASPGELRLLGIIPGGRREEIDIQNRFTNVHYRGEWFSPSMELLRFIRHNTDGSRCRSLDKDKTVADLQVVTGLGVNAVKAGIRSGQLPGSKVNGKYVIPADAFDAYCLAGRWPIDQMPTPIRPVTLLHRKAAS